LGKLANRVRKMWHGHCFVVRIGGWRSPKGRGCYVSFSFMANSFHCPLVIVESIVISGFPEVPESGEDLLQKIV